jgi:hypothetical protein
MTLSKEERYKRQKIYKQSPETKEKRRIYDANRLKQPEVVARMKAYRQSERGKLMLKKASEKYRATDRYKQYRKEYKNTEKYKLYRRNHLYLKKFGICLDDYNKKLSEQNNVCAICLRPETFVLKGIVPSLAVDHCHKTGKVRGLLCRKCNQMLGLAEDNQNTLSNAIIYLKR